MSITFLNYHNENIYDITKKPENKKNRQEKYNSIFTKKNISNILNIRYEQDEPNKRILNTESKYAAHKTMGYAETPLLETSHFLRKNHGIKFSRLATHKCEKISHISAPVSKNIVGINSRKNFPNWSKKPLSMKTVIRANGDTVQLCKAGLMPFYIFYPNFGKTPKYLENITKNIRKASIKSQNEDESKLSNHIKIVSNEVRSEIISGLKKKWIEIMDHFQAGPIYADTIPQKNRKTKIENELRRIEQDIAIIENNPVIYRCLETAK